MISLDTFLTFVFLIAVGSFRLDFSLSFFFPFLALGLGGVYVPWYLTVWCRTALTSLMGFPLALSIWRRLSVSHTRDSISVSKFLVWLPYTSSTKFRFNQSIFLSLTMKFNILTKTTKQNVNIEHDHLTFFMHFVSVTRVRTFIPPKLT